MREEDALGAGVAMGKEAFLPCGFSREDRHEKKVTVRAS